ncbi:hypothetical protein DOX45_01215 [Cronobacter malonaticus]|nr:hypothetical protein [Cronobacter malonaticus]
MNTAKLKAAAEKAKDDFRPNVVVSTRDVLELIAALESAAPKSAAARDILAERQRQISAEGWTPEHDDEHSDGSLADAAACYALLANSQLAGVPCYWPWDAKWWKPKNQRADLVRAAALIVAEIERIDRASGINLETGGE